MPEIFAKLESIEAEARAKAWLLELLWNGHAACITVLETRREGIQVPMPCRLGELGSAP
jgi:hypothetical protein